MKKLHWAAAILIVALGVLHTVVTFFEYDRLTMNAVWFAGTGIAIILAGFLNVALIRDAGKDSLVSAMCIVTNLLFFLGFGGATFMLPQPQVFIGVAIFGIATIGSLFAPRG